MMTKKQVNNVKKFLKSMANGQAKHITSEDKIRAEYYLKQINVKSNLLYIIDIISYFTVDSEKYILNTIINGLNLYNTIEIRTYDTSTTKNRFIYKSITKVKSTRKELIELADRYIRENNVKLIDVAYRVI